MAGVARGSARFIFSEDTMQRQRTVFAIILALTLCSTSFAQEQPRRVPPEVNALVGTYTGAWTSYGIDDKGQVVKLAAWTDILKAERPIVEGDRAFVATVDEIIYEGGKIPPLKVRGTEGYYLNKDGSLGDYYFENFGRVYRLQKLGKDVWAYAVPADPRELAQLGFANVASAQHVLVKVVTSEQGVETHRNSRVTTVNWKDAEGKDRWLQFVSLQGAHRRQP